MPRIDPLELLAFIESGMSMTGEQIAAPVLRVNQRCCN